MKFTDSHEWVELKDMIATVGITDWAQRQFGEVVHVALPKIQEKIKAQKEICVIESAKAASDIYSPLSGRILEVNEQLRIYPQLINEDAQKRGWIYKMEIFDRKEYENLLDMVAYKALTFS